METFLQQLINGISQGSAYALLALGYTMVYGVLRLINFAHSDVYMFGAFMGLYIANNAFVKSVVGTSVFGAVVVMIGAMAACALLGLVIERFAYRPGRSPVRFVLAFWLGLLGAAFGFQQGGIVAILAGTAVGAIIGGVLERFGAKPAPQSSSLKLLIVAIGASLVLENGGQLVFGATPRQFPDVIPSTTVAFGGLTVGTARIVVLVVSLLLMVALNVIVNYTKTGKAMRAVSFNLSAARLMGINTDAIIAFTFALGAALAGAGGILVSMMYPSITPLMGVFPGLKAFVAAVLGGIGNIVGAMVGGLIIGIVETMTAGYGFSTYKDAIAFVILVLILLIKPTGIMGKGMVEKV
jgi:branched-chain amino acid transport system permease protein